MAIATISGGISLMFLRMLVMKVMSGKCIQMEHLVVYME